MKTKAVRLYGKSDLRMEEFELPKLGKDEILAKVISDSLCMSSYKSATQGADHKRVPNDVDVNPTIIGHEFCGEIVEVGEKWAGEFKAGVQFSIQPALNYKGSHDAPGYSYRFIGGDATYIIIPNEVMEMNCLLPYTGDAFFKGSLAEPMSCVIGAFHANYHIQQGSYVHEMGIVEGGVTALLAGVGPMGLAAIDYAINCDRKPGKLIVTDIDKVRLDRAATLYTVADAKKNGLELFYVNTGEMANPIEGLLELSPDGFDDVFVFAPVPPVIEQADGILAKDGCLNFFAGPSNPQFKATMNFYNVHYAGTHIVGTSGGNNDDLTEALKMLSEGSINPAAMVTHIGGLNCVADTTLRLPKIPGGKKLIYTHIELELTAIDDFETLGKENALFAKLAKIVKANNGLWSSEAEKVLLGELM